MTMREELLLAANCLSSKCKLGSGISSQSIESRTEEGKRKTKGQKLSCSSKAEFSIFHLAL